MSEGERPFISGKKQSNTKAVGEANIKRRSNKWKQ